MQKKSHFVYFIEHFLLWVPGDPFDAVTLRKYFMHMRVNYYELNSEIIMLMLNR